MNIKTRSHFIPGNCKVLALFSENNNTLNAHHLKLMQSIASQVSFAVEYFSQ
jgi:hypothetical protein